MIFYFAPDAEQEWIWITPGSVAGTILWLITSLGFKFYVANFGSYNATCDVDGELAPAAAVPVRARASDLGSQRRVLAEAALLAYAKLRSRFQRPKT